MKIENQVCTLEQAKKLKELGIVQESYLYWEELHNVEGCRLTVCFNSGHPISYSVVKAKYSAYTVAELGAMLPEEFSSWKYENEYGSQWDCVADENNYANHRETMHPFEAQSRAAMLIWLRENEFVTAEQCNKLLENA